MPKIVVPGYQIELSPYLNKSKCLLVDRICLENYIKLVVLELAVILLKKRLPQ